ncbi:MAG: DUF3995 domain-containing protein [Dehalococcoidia bacterium]|nr:DUF3995 domain-containing protein [Dehalococcoidia bacterium]
MTGTRADRVTWPASAASLWAFGFAAMSFYWAAGGTFGLETLGEGMREDALARDPELIAMTWLTGVLKAIAGLLALALVQGWGRRFPHQLLLWSTLGAGLLFALYAIGNGVQHTMMLTGASPIPDVLGTEAAVRWHLFFWDPFWLVGGLLFLAAAATYRWGGAKAVLKVRQRLGIET